MSFAAIHIPEFPAAAWRRTLPSAAQEPLVLLEGVAPQERVASLCGRALAAGVEHGMSRVQAEAVGLVLVKQRDHREEERAYARVLGIAESFSPRLQAIAAPGNDYASSVRLDLLLLLDGVGMRTLYGEPPQFARRLACALVEVGFRAGIGAAPNAQASLLLARTGMGVCCADAHELTAKLAPLAVDLLPCEPHTLQVLAWWGIRTLGQLASLPEKSLVSRLGQQAKRLQQLARGEAEHLLVAEEAEFTLRESIELDHPLELLDPLLFVLSPILEALLRRAREHGYSLRVVRLTLRLERAEPHTLSVHPAAPSDRCDLWLKLLHLELQARPPQAPVVAVTLEGEAAKPQVAQCGLFQAEFPEPDKLDLLLARLRSIKGERNIGSPVIENTHRPDGFHLVPFAPSIHAKATGTSTAAKLALRLCRPPRPVQVQCRNNAPQSVLRDGVRHAVISASGPWHSSGAWWSEQAWDTVFWDVVTAEPLLALRLEQHGTSGSWYLTGLYD